MLCSQVLRVVEDLEVRCMAQILSDKPSSIIRGQNDNLIEDTVEKL